jgi:hypothetical protein
MGGAVLSRRLAAGLGWTSAVAAVAAFFLPWAKMDVRENEAARGLTKALGRITVQIQRGGETIAGEMPNLSDIPRQVSGVEIPRVANDPDAKVALALFEIVTDSRQHLGLKSYAVYLVPGMALAAAFLLAALGARRPVALGIAVLCAAVAASGAWKLLTADTETLLVAITIGPGLWLSVGAYAALSLAAFIDTLSSRPL